jgi:hypothetical protein
VVDLATLGELMTPLTREQVEETVYESLAAVGFPTTAWGTYSVPRRLITAFAEVIESVSLWISWIARSGVIDLAEDNGWLELAGTWYEEPRHAAALTVGTIVLTDHGGGPHTIAVGAVTVQSDTGLLYTNTTGGTLTLNGTLNLSFRAAQPGESYNAPGGTITTLVTTLPTVTITNAADWVTTTGRDKERASDYISRLKAKWATLGTGTPALALVAVARTAAPGVTKVTVRDDNPIGNATAQVVCATGAGPASAADVALVDAALQAIRATGSVVEAVAAVALAIPVTATIRVLAAERVTAEAEVIQAFADYQRDLPIGAGSAGTVYRAQIVELLMSGTGVQNVVLSTLVPAGDTSVSPTQVVAFTLTLTWEEVASS